MIRGHAHPAEKWDLPKSGDKVKKIHIFSLVTTLEHRDELVRSAAFLILRRHGKKHDIKAVNSEIVLPDSKGV